MERLRERVINIHHSFLPAFQGGRPGLSQEVRWHLEDRVLVYGNKTVVFT